MDDSTKINISNNSSEELTNINDQQTTEKRAEEVDKTLSLKSEKDIETNVVRENYDEYAPYNYDEMSVDPYLEPDPTIPEVVYKESHFLYRGCNHCPESYVPVSETELGSCCKLNSKNWMKNIRPTHESMFDIVEVRFKNNRKDFYRLPDGLEVTEGDVVAVEGVPGHDVGIVSMTGELCRLQIKKRKIDVNSDSIKRLFRRAKKSDIDRWEEAMKRETNALIKTRMICENLGLSMKINDVEFQGDNSKAIFYYTADERVDFRNLIKVLAEEFKVRIEMKQIGIRQEAGKVGGIGTCGRELCCCTWLTNFQSVTTSVAKAQQILPNPQKLAGQCGKLKCCLNFEYEVYADALKSFPPSNTSIRTKKGLGLHKKTDVLRGLMWYSYEGENDMYAIPVDAVKEIIEMNNKQQYPDKLEDYQTELMSATVLMEENSHEFEMELMKMEDSATDIEAAESTANHNKKNQQHNSSGKQHRNNKNDKNKHNDRNSKSKDAEHKTDKPNNRNGKKQNKNKHRNSGDGQQRQSANNVEAKPKDK